MIDKLEKPKTGKRKRFLADGISIVENKAFQSYIFRAFKNKKGVTALHIPLQIANHLTIAPDDIIEVAIRKVTKEYAAENYGIKFWSFKTICPKCHKQGRVQQQGGNYLITHYFQKGKQGCYINKRQFKELQKLNELNKMKERGKAGEDETCR